MKKEWCAPRTLTLLLLTTPRRGIGIAVKTPGVEWNEVEWRGMEWSGVEWSGLDGWVRVVCE